MTTLQELPSESQAWSHVMTAATGGAAAVSSMAFLDSATQEAEIANGGSGLSMRHMTSTGETNGHGPMAGSDTKSENDAGNPDVLKSLVTSLSQLGLLQKSSSADAGSEQQKMQLPPSTNPSSSGYCWPVAEDSNYISYGNRGSIHQDFSLESSANSDQALLNANLAAQLQAYEDGRYQQHMPRRPITGNHPLGASLAPSIPQQLLQSRQFSGVGNVKPYPSGVPTLNGANNIGNPSWGVSGSQGVQRGNIQHGRSMSVQNISMSGGGVPVGMLQSGWGGNNYGRTVNYMTSGSANAGYRGVLNPLTASARHGNGKSIPEHLQMGKSDSTGQYAGRMSTEQLLKNLSSGYHAAVIACAFMI